ELAERDWHGVRHDDRQEGQAAEEIRMNDASFLSQLEQRTQQVKITLANLEAERVRIEGLISRLQPLVPHYDALIAAERAIDESRIELDALSGTRNEERVGRATGSGSLRTRRAGAALRRTRAERPRHGNRSLRRGVRAWALRRTRAESPRHGECERHGKWESRDAPCRRAAVPVSLIAWRPT